MGVDTLELDVGVTRDGVVVIHHDRRLNPDVARKDGQWVSAPAPTDPLPQLSENCRLYDVGRIRPGSEYAARFPHQKPIDGTRIPRLDDLLAKMRNGKVRFNIETKLVPQAPDETLRAGAFRARGDRRSAQGGRGDSAPPSSRSISAPSRWSSARRRKSPPPTSLRERIRTRQGARSRRARMVAGLPRP